MNPRIMKLRADYKKNEDKISELQKRNHNIMLKIHELEDIEIVGIVRTNKVTVEELSEFLKKFKNSPVFPDTQNNQTEEEKPDEKI